MICFDAGLTMSAGLKNNHGFFLSCENKIEKFSLCYGTAKRAHKVILNRVDPQMIWISLLIWFAYIRGRVEDYGTLRKVYCAEFSSPTRKFLLVWDRIWLMYLVERGSSMSQCLYIYVEKFGSSVNTGPGCPSYNFPWFHTRSYTIPGNHTRSYMICMISR